MKIKKREIKFRGFSSDSNKWIYGYLNRPFDDITQIIEKIPSNASQMSLVVNGSEGQFTGLLDKNGKEIYEGDIIDCHQVYDSDFLGVVVFKNCSFLIKKPNPTNSIHYIDIYFFTEKCEVIGNIYEDSKLIKYGK